MGRFVYEGAVKVDLDDRLLAHLQVAITTKLRRGESFSFTWKDDPRTGEGRTSVWLHPHCSMVYKFFGSRRPRINLAWVDALAAAANSASGLSPVPEPAALGGAEGEERIDAGGNATGPG